MAASFCFRSYRPSTVLEEDTHLKSSPYSICNPLMNKHARPLVGGKPAFGPAERRPPTIRHLLDHDVTQPPTGDSAVSTLDAWRRSCTFLN
ncbi:hypothetical protein ZHAS_00009287 [Anopheles sinensis]|uniref:Uncharacterized protein n=1 Tax=Anopheles sinensis TaxID=74873 RepID=A0A084VUL2_ANOSI|nr:hypothetical protein ZHAS_00009287 [Anopheles sinensis]